MAHTANESLDSSALADDVMHHLITSQWSLSNTSTEAPYQQMISDQTTFYLTIYLFIILCVLVAVFGVINNVINMVIFYRLGFKDSMSVFLFGLSFTDCFLSFVILFTRLITIWAIYFPKGDFEDPYHVLLAGPSWVADSLFLCSGWIMSILSLERCVCVVFPFHVKQIFTVRRSFFAVVVIHIVTQAINIPVYMGSWLERFREDVSTTNTTIIRHSIKIQFAHNYVEMESYVMFINVTIVPIPSLAILLIGVFWMIYGLYASSQTRQAMTMTVSKTDKEGQKDGSRLDVKTRRLVKVVLLLAIIFIVCSIPRIGATLTITVNPEVSHEGKEQNWSIVNWHFARLFSAVNASVNIFVYLIVNSSYRVKFQEIFNCS